LPSTRLLGHVPDGRHEFFTEIVENCVENSGGAGIFRDFPALRADCTNMVRSADAAKQHIIAVRPYFIEAAYFSEARVLQRSRALLSSEG
jgi:hypothetical protein